MAGTVGIMVGMTTPEVELNQLITPEARASRAGAVRGIMMLARPAASRSMPPAVMTTFISTPMPVTSRMVFQGMDWTHLEISATPSAARMQASRKQVRPMLVWKTTTHTTITRMDSRVSR